MSSGCQSCNAEYLGSYGHEEQDVQTLADWGFDYYKLDWCFRPVKEWSIEEAQKPYKLVKSALDKVNRDIVYSLCGGGFEVWKWGGAVGNLWRTAGDGQDTWEGVCYSGFNQEHVAPYQKPGNWNDPDLLMVGYHWNNSQYPHQTPLTYTEQYTHISLWSLLGAPLLLSCDLTKIDNFMLNLLSNDEVIAIDQDPLGKQGVAVIKDPNYQIMVKDLEDGSKAVGLFNLSENDLKITAPWEALTLKGKQKVRDLWRQKDLGVFDGKFEAEVPPHGVVLVKIGK